MDLKSLVAELNKNTFDPSDISDLDCFLSLHEGQTLFEHMDKKNNAFALMNLAMLELTKLGFDLVGAYDAREVYDLFCANLYQMCYTLVQRESYQVIEQAANDPSEFFTFLNRSSKSLVFQFYEYFHIQSLISGFIRSIYLNKQLTELTQNCQTVAELKNIKSGLISLGSMPLFVTHRSYAGWALQGLTQFARSVTTYVPEYTTETVAFITGAIAGLDSIESIDMLALTAEQQRQRIKLLTQVYLVAQSDLQKNIVQHLETLVIAQQHNPGVMQVISHVLFDIPSLYRHTKPALVSQLTPEANLLLLRSYHPQLYTQDSQEYFVALISNLRFDARKQKYEFCFSPATNEAEELLLRILSCGNFPQVSELFVPINACKLTPSAYVPLLFSDKLVLTDSSKPVENAEEPLPSMLSLYRYLLPLAPNENEYFIDTSTMRSSYVNIQLLIQYAHEHGNDHLGLTTYGIQGHTALKPKLRYLRDLATLPKNFIVYHKLIFKTGALIDLFSDSEGTHPGPVTEQSIPLKLLFNTLNLAHTHVPEPTSALSLIAGNFTSGSSSQSHATEIEEQKEKPVANNFI